MPDKLDEKHWTVWVAWTIMWWLRRQVSDLCFPIYVFQSKCVSIIDDIRSVEMMS